MQQKEDNRREERKKEGRAATKTKTNGLPGREEPAYKLQGGGRLQKHHRSFTLLSTNLFDGGFCHLTQTRWEVDFEGNPTSIYQSVWVPLNLIFSSIQQEQQIHVVAESLQLFLSAPHLHKCSLCFGVQARRRGRPLCRHVWTGWWETAAALSSAVAGVCKQEEQQRGVSALRT